MYRSRATNYVMFFLSCVAVAACNVCFQSASDCEICGPARPEWPILAGFLAGFFMAASFLYRGPVVFEDWPHELQPQNGTNDEF